MRFASFPFTVYIVGLSRYTCSVPQHIVSFEHGIIITIWSNRQQDLFSRGTSKFINQLKKNDVGFDHMTKYNLGKLSNSVTKRGSGGTSNNSLLSILDLFNFAWRKQMSSHHYVSPYWLVNTSNSDHSDWHISQVVLNSLTCWKFIASYMRKSSFMRKKSSSKW